MTTYDLTEWETRHLEYHRAMTDGRMSRRDDPQSDGDIGWSFA
jgi:hypothetical protein